ncbi:N-acetyltransferase family protein, partial [Rhizobium phaseoli]
MTDAVLIRDATDADLPAIREIYNHAVEHTTAIWNETL